MCCLLVMGSWASRSAFNINQFSFSKQKATLLVVCCFMLILQSKKLAFHSREYRLKSHKNELFDIAAADNVDVAGSATRLQTGR